MINIHYCIKRIAKKGYYAENQIFVMQNICFFIISQHIY